MTATAPLFTVADYDALRWLALTREAIALTAPGWAVVSGPASKDACSHALSAADDERAPVSVLRCLTCREPIGTYYPDLPAWVVSHNASTGS